MAVRQKKLRVQSYGTCPMEIFGLSAPNPDVLRWEWAISSWLTRQERDRKIQKQATKLAMETFLIAFLIVKQTIYIFDVKKQLQQLLPLRHHSLAGGPLVFLSSSHTANETLGPGRFGGKRLLQNISGFTFWGSNTGLFWLWINNLKNHQEPCCFGNFGALRI